MNSFPKSITVIGSGVSAIETVKFCIQNSIKVFLSDTAPEEKVSEILKNEKLEIDFEGGGNSERVFEGELIVVSPGVPSTAPVIKNAIEKNIELIGTLEFGFQNCVAPFVALTGSSGKSTTVSLINSVFKSAEIETALCGNIGTPVLGSATKLDDKGYAVCEVSSFQLETIKTFAPKIAVILNLTPNHLDRHSSFEEYCSLKTRIIENMKSGTVVLNGADKLLLEFGKSISDKKLEIIFFGTIVDGYKSLVEKNGEAFLVDENGVENHYASFKNLQLIGEHNIQNALATAAVSVTKNISAQNFEEGIKNFSGLEHRMEKVTVHNGVSFYNDSKATTPESVAAALSGFRDNSVRLIAGGKDKGGNFGAISEIVSKKCKRVYLIGSATKTLSKSWNSVEIRECKSLKEAVKLSVESANSGESVVLSPGCASFDMFSSFIERGELFKKAVLEVTSC
jgi:UDP-N-acetylmuramoylalanine--D-glutamate ligase